MPWLSATLLVLLVLVQSALWFGRGGITRSQELAQRLEQQEQANQEARAINERLAAEVRDLQQGLEIAEEKARFELGMVKRDEILVQVAPPR